MTELREIEIKVTNTRGCSMSIAVPADDTLDDWHGTIKTILTYLGFAVDEVLINPDSDDLQEKDNA